MQIQTSQKCGCYFAMVEDPESKGHASMVCPIHSQATDFLDTMRHLLIVARRWHGYDDPQHRQAMPYCTDCLIIHRGIKTGA